MSRSGRTSLFQQGQQAIIACISVGESKRSDRRQRGGATDWKIYGVSYLNDLKTTNKDLMTFIRANYPDCKYIRNIQPEMLQAWLDGKADAGASQEYIGKLISHLRKLEACYKHKYSGINLHLEHVKPPICQIGSKQRDKVMDDGAYTRLLQAMPRTTEAWKSVVLSHTLGLRVAETANIKADHVELTGGRWGFGRAVLHGREDGCKGGRWRTVDILSASDQEAVKSCLEGAQAGQTIIRKADGTPYKVDSLQRAIDRAADKAGLTDWKQNKGHSLRKHFAQECYDAVGRETGDDKKACEYVNEQLGHGANRKSLNAVYIADRWILSR